MQNNELIIDFSDYSPVNEGKIKEKSGNPVEISGLIKSIIKDEDSFCDKDNTLSDDECWEILCPIIQGAIKTKGNNIINIKPKKDENINKLNDNDDGVSLFSILDGKRYTGGYVGVINLDIKGYSVTINFRSRFDKDEQSPFLMYVFQKAFNAKGKIYDDMKISGSTDKTWDFLLMISFVHYLHDALKKGIYRQYQEFEYNDSKIKGRIDIARHIKTNMLANGKVCYTTREFTANNPINHLILKAASYLEKKYRSFFNSLVTSDETVKKGIQVLKTEIEEWELLSERDVIKKSNKKIVQPVYKNYEPLRKISIAILRRLGVNNYKSSSDDVSGVLIYMPNLWEEFLYKEIFSKILGTQKEYKQEPYPILEEKKSQEKNSKGRRKLKPDFYLEDKAMVFDAKYKSNWGEVYKNELNGLNDWNDKVREDVFQVLAYMYALGCQYGGVIFPYQDSKLEECSEYDIKDNIFKIGQKRENDEFCLIPVLIPKNIDDMSKFNKHMSDQSEKIKKKITELKLKDN